MIRKTLFNPSWWNRREYKDWFWQKERMAEKEEIRKAVVSMSEERYNELLDAERELDALYAAGVDNWEGYGDAFPEEE